MTKPNVRKYFEAICDECGWADHKLCYRDARETLKKRGDKWVCWDCAKKLPKKP